MFRTKKKGVTLLELILVLAISSIVLGIVFTFFLSNSRAINETQIHNDLQREGQTIVSKITESMMSAKKIESITDSNNLDASGLKSCNISFVNFTLLNGSKTYQVNGSKLEEDATVIATDVEAITLSTIDDANFDSCKGIKITINLVKKYINKNITYQITSDIIFRNSDIKP